MTIYPFKSMLSSAFVFIFYLCPLQSVHANERSHEHGVGRIFISVEGSDVEVELVVPGADAVGFEHTASTDDDRKAVAAAIKTLREVDDIIILTPEAMCRAEEPNVHSSLMDEKKENASHSHKHNGKSEDIHEEMHAEFVAYYHFHCEKPMKLNGIKVGFFNIFPSTHELSAKWITPNGQGATELTAKSPGLKF